MFHTFPEKRIKVLFLAGWYPNRDNPISGIFIKRHAEAVSRYCDVAVLYIHHWSFGKSAKIDYTIEDGIRTIRVYPESFHINNRLLRYLFNSIFNNFLINSYKGLKVVQKEFGRPDVVHVNVCLPMGILALILDLFKGIPFIVTEHSSYLLNKIKNPFEYIDLKLILKKSKYVCPVSQSLKMAMETVLRENKFKVIPNVVNTDLFSPHPSKKNREKKKILHVSLMCDEEKDISGILFAIHKILKSRDDFELYILGDGIDRMKLENLSIHLGIKDTVVFFKGLVNTEELLNFLHDSDFFVLNSNYETFCVACAEALAAGIPIIATRCGGPEDFINENVGILIEKGNKEELISAINYMLDNSGKYDPSVLHEYAKERFGYEVVGKEFFNLYKSLSTK